MNSNQNVTATELLQAVQETSGVTPDNDTPNCYMARLYPAVADLCGEAFELYVAPKHEAVTGLNDDFFAEILGHKGSPEAPTVYLSSEACFVTYDPKEGIFVKQSDEVFGARLSDRLREIARSCNTHFDIDKVRFEFRRQPRLRGVVERAKGRLHVGPEYFKTGDEEIIACQNGMLDVKSRTLLPFGPQFRRRSKLRAKFEPGATCPKFLHFLSEALDDDDQRLLQQCCGLYLIGVNLSQVMLVACGATRTGKGTFVRILTGIMGTDPILGLRTKFLKDRFEIGAAVGKTLLYGADVAPDFLSTEGTELLKALTGGDPLTAEFKHANERTPLYGTFNVLITANAKPAVRIQGDADAWVRRLRVIEFTHKTEITPNVHLSEELLDQESAGILNWMIEGLIQLRAQGWMMPATGGQKQRVQNLVLESQSTETFCKTQIEVPPDPDAQLTIAEAYQDYLLFCHRRAWLPADKKIFTQTLEDVVLRRFGKKAANSVAGVNGKDNRGFRGLGLIPLGSEG